MPFATGRDKNMRLFAVTTGILSILNKVELEGVISMNHLTLETKRHIGCVNGVCRACRFYMFMRSQIF